jgi:hypothetical protein
VLPYKSSPNVRNVMLLVSFHDSSLVQSYIIRKKRGFYDLVKLCQKFVSKLGSLWYLIPKTKAWISKITELFKHTQRRNMWKRQNHQWYLNSHIKLNQVYNPNPKTNKLPIMEWTSIIISSKTIQIHKQNTKYQTNLSQTYIHKPCDPNSQTVLKTPNSA